MKKILSIGLALLMALCMGTAAFAGTINTPGGSGNSAVEYNVEPTYMVTIPNAIKLGGTGKVKAENVVIEPGKTVKVSIDGPYTVSQGDDTLEYMVSDGEADIPSGAAVLTVDPAVSPSGEAILNFSLPTKDAVYSGKYTGNVTFTVKVESILDSITERINRIQPGSTDTVTIDGVEWYVLAKEGGQAMILSKEILEKYKFDSDSPQWQTSDMRAYLNGAWLNGKAILSSVAAETTLTTRSTFDGTDFTETRDRVFLLSEADVSGTQNGNPAQDKDYTYNESTLSAPGGSWKTQYEGTDTHWWLRSPKYMNEGVAVVLHTGAFHYGNYFASIGVRPALWINLK